MDHCKIDFLIFFHFQLILSKSNFFLQNKKERLAKLVSQDQPHWANDVATIVCVVVAFSFSSIADTSCFSLRNVRSSSSLCGITSIRGEASGFWRRCVILARARYVALQLPHALLRRCCVGGQGLAGGTDRSRRGGRRQPARVCSQTRCCWSGEEGRGDSTSALCIARHHHGFRDERSQKDWNWAYGIRCPVYFLGCDFLLRQRTFGHGQYTIRSRSNDNNWHKRDSVLLPQASQL